MGLEAIESSGPRALDAARHPLPQTTKAPAPTARATVETTGPDPEKSVQGVPRHLGVQQQIPPNTRLHLDEESQQIVAQILDENNEVVRQIPPEALLELSARFNRLEGLLFNRES